MKRHYRSVLVVVLSVVAMWVGCWWYFQKQGLASEFEARGIAHTSGGFRKAVREGDTGAVKLYLADGFSPNTRYGPNQEPVLFDAIASGNLEVVRAIVDAGADVDAVAAVGGHQAIHVACRYGYPAILLKLLGAGADPNAEGDVASEGGAFVPLFAAVMGNASGPAETETEERIATVEILLEHGARVNVYHPGVGLAGPLHVASGNGFHKIAELLLKHGADSEQEDRYGSTPLMDAAIRGDPRTIGVLLGRGAKVDHRTSRGTALLLAAQYGNLQAVQMLLRAGGNAQLKNDAGKTAFDVARSPAVLRALHGLQ